jgi:hypothetical protein
LIWQQAGLERDRLRAHIPEMQRRAWKIILRVPGLDGKSGSNEYFVVKDSDRMSALAALLRARPDLGNYAYEFKGEGLTRTCFASWCCRDFNQSYRSFIGKLD